MMLTSKGAAGITGAGLVALTASLQTFGGDFFTAESIAIGLSLVVGIDRIMSEGRALTNVISNRVATMVVSKMMGEVNEERFKAVLNDPSLADPDHPDAVYEAEVEEALRREAEAEREAQPVPV
jgi:aerobic C4-dicarboxylate transport protein